METFQRLASYYPGEVDITILKEKKSGLSLRIGMMDGKITRSKVKTVIRSFEKGIIIETPLEYFLSYCKYWKIDFDIFVIPAIGKFKKEKASMIVFPISYQFTNEKGEERVGFIRNNVLIKNKLYNHNKIFGDKELLNTDRMLTHINPDLMLTVSFFLASMPYNNFLSLKKVILTPLRRFFYQNGIIDENRGKTKGNFMGLRNKFIINEYKRLGKPSRNPIKKIQGAWDEKVNNVFCLRDSAKASKYYCHDVTVWRTLKNLHKK